MMATRCLVVLTLTLSLFGAHAQHFGKKRTFDDIEYNEDGTAKLLYSREEIYDSLMEGAAKYAALNQAGGLAGKNARNMHDAMNDPRGNFRPVEEQDRMEKYGESAYMQNLTKSMDPSAPMEGCVELNSENYERIFAGNRYTSIFFYTPWSGGAKKIAVEYEKFTSQVYRSADQISKVLPCKVDCDEQPKICELFEVYEFPQIMYMPRRATLKDCKTAVTVSGGRNAGAFSTIIIDTALNDMAFGRHKKLDKYVTKWMKLSPKKKKKQLRDAGQKYDEICKEAEEKQDEDGVLGCKVYKKYLEIILEKGSRKAARDLQKAKHTLERDVENKIRDPNENYAAFVEHNIVAFIIGEMVELMDDDL